MEERKEIVEEYRHPEPVEVVEVYSRPLPGWKEPEGSADLQAELEWLRRRRNRKRGLWIFLACLAVIVLAVALVRLLTPRTEPVPNDPFEWDPRAGEEQELSGEITMERFPSGQGTTLEIVRQQGEVLSAQELYRQVNPAVVTVVAYKGNGASVGTGVIFSEDGYVMTNYHTLDGGNSCVVILDGGYTCPAFYVAGDMSNDLAVLKIDAEGVPAAEFGDSDLLSVGDPVYAIGNPLGVELRGTLTNGIVSAINRDVWVDDRYMTLIQTNAAMNVGNSGGPLINEYGQVVGINVIKMTSRYSTVEGLGFAIPSASIERIANDLLIFGAVQPEPLLGISVIIEADEVEPGLWGLRVDSVTEGGVGEAAGVRTGDYVLAADGEPLLTSSDLLRVRRHHYLGETMVLTLWRDGEVLEATLYLNQSVED